MGREKQRLDKTRPAGHRTGWVLKQRRLPEDGNLEEAVQKLEELLSKFSIDGDTSMDPPLSKLFANAIKILEEAPEETKGQNPYKSAGKEMTKAQFQTFVGKLNTIFGDKFVDPEKIINTKTKQLVGQGALLARGLAKIDKLSLSENKKWDLRRLMLEDIGDEFLKAVEEIEVPEDDKTGLKKARPRLLKVFQDACLLYTSPSPRDLRKSRLPSSA